jgi:hypothetical protein
MQQGKQLTIAALLLMLGGCSGAADAIGLGRNAPDEFAVVERPPLSLPPDYELRPPRPGAPRPQEVSMPDRASQTVFGRATPSSTGEPTSGSDAEKALLQAAGTDKADSGIRSVIDREASQKVVGSRPLVDEILWWRSSEKSGTVVDAAAEAERIKEAKEKGESITSGATPVIEKSKSGWLGL